MVLLISQKLEIRSLIAFFLSKGKEVVYWRMFLHRRLLLFAFELWGFVSFLLIMS